MLVSFSHQSDRIVVGMGFNLRLRLSLRLGLGLGLSCLLCLRMAEDTNDAMRFGQVKAIANTEAILAELAGETVHMVGVLLGSHNQLVGRNGPLAGRASAVLAEYPEKVAPAEDLVRVGEQGGADLAEATIAAGALEAVFVPLLVERLQKVTLLDWFGAGRANVRLLIAHLDQVRIAAGLLAVLSRLLLNGCG